MVTDCLFLVMDFQALAAEVTSTFSHRLSPLNMTVRELTGDMQLSKNELEETQVFLIFFFFYQIRHAQVSYGNMCGGTNGLPSYCLSIR